jgi:integrase
MQLRAHDNRDDMKVWLDEPETQLLLNAVEDTEHWIALALGVRCGLRSHEILNVRPDHVVRDETLGHILRVPEGKGDKYRETPCPESVAMSMSALADARDDHGPAVTCTSTRTLRRWVSKAAAAVDDETDGWQYLTPHDLRRTWATALVASDIDPLIVCDWGGWNKLDTFLEHYRGVYSPKKQSEARAKADWL